MTRLASFLLIKLLFVFVLIVSIGACSSANTASVVQHVEKQERLSRSTAPDVFTTNQDIAQLDYHIDPARQFDNQHQIYYQTVTVNVMIKAAENETLTTMRQQAREESVYIAVKLVNDHLEQPTEATEQIIAATKHSTPLSDSTLLSAEAESGLTQVTDLNQQTYADIMRISKVINQFCVPAMFKGKHILQCETVIDVPATEVIEP